jgi:hypothetical protein
VWQRRAALARQDESLRKTMKYVRVIHLSSHRQTVHEVHVLRASGGDFVRVARRRYMK